MSKLRVPSGGFCLLILLNNYFRLNVCLSCRTSVRTSHFHFFWFPAVVSQNVTYKSCLACVKSKRYASWFTIRPQWDCCCRGEAKVRTLGFKTTLSEFQKPGQTAPAEAKPRCVYWILKPHGQSSRCKVRLPLAEAKPRCVYSILKPHSQSFITSPQSVQSSCVC